MSYAFSYDLTLAELGTGGKLLSRRAYSGGWKALLWAYSLGTGMCYAVTGFVVSFLIINALGVDYRSVPFAWWGLGMLIAAGMGWTGGSLRKHWMQNFETSKFLKDQTVLVSMDGIRMDNGRSTLQLHWADVESIIETPSMLVVCYGNAGIFLPDRLLQEAGDPADLRAQTKAWFEQAREAAA